MPRIPINIAELVGGTPLIALPRMLAGTPASSAMLIGIRGIG